MLISEFFDESQSLPRENPNGKIQRRTFEEGIARGKRANLAFEFTARIRAGRSQPPTDGSTKVFLTAGNQIYTAKGNRIARFAIPGADGTAKQAADWKAEIQGNVWTMLAADDRLFVVTREGRIYCFGADKQKLTQHAIPKNVAAKAGADSARLGATVIRAARLPARTGITQADPVFCPVFGQCDAALVTAIVRAANVYPIVIDSDTAAVAKLRKSLSDAGLYGTYASAHLGDAIRPLPPYLAECVLVIDPKSAGLDFSPGSVQRLFRPLRPYGGTALLKLSDKQHAAFTKAVSLAKLPNATVARDGVLTVLKRVGALPRSAGWTHQYGSATNSVVSRDDLVKAPLGVLWFGGPSHSQILPRHGHGPNPQVAGGRLVIEGPDILRAVDVYTGRLLWEVELKGVGKYYDNTRHHPGAGEIGTNYVTLPDAVYVVYGSKLIELDAATGKQRRSYALKPEPGKASPQWGYAAADGDFLIATSSPVKLGKSFGGGKAAAIPKGYRGIVKSGARWKYLAGRDARSGWTQLSFNDSKWKTGPAGFGYGDGDDATILKDMKDKYSRVYIRHTFDAKDVGKTGGLGLLANYDDAFIAYLNGKEIVRAGVGKGRGVSAKRIKSHEAEKFEFFRIADFRKLLRPGKNVLAVEGHNGGISSSDFSLDVLLIALGKAESAKKKDAPKAAGFQNVQYSSASKRLVVYDRKTGRRLWQREAEFNFRHNCIAAANGKLFCIDGLSPGKLQLLKRRGIDASGKARLYALDLKTGKVLWSTSEDVFGTFLNYSVEHDVLLQAGSAYRDRAADEVSRGMVAYRARDGKVLWKDLKLSYGGPCMLWRDKIITNGGGGFQLELLTGKKTGWSYGRMYGCNTAVGGQHMLTFRSGAAGFCDLTGDSGTGNIGGFRSSCTSNLIAADGVLSAPDYTRTCSCAYQNQTSLALIHMPDNEFWTFNKRDVETGPRIGWNLGAPGDRRSPEGTLWFDIPSVGGPSPIESVKVEPKAVQWYSRHSSVIAAGPLKWVAASGGKGIRKLTVNPGSKKPGKYTVRLFFAEPDPVKVGARVFSVTLQGKTVATGVDVIRSAGGRNRSMVREFRNVSAGGTLEIGLQPKAGTKLPPILSGVELIRER